MFAALNSFLTRAVSGYFLNKSLRFRSSASAYLNRTASASISTFTVSMWVKRGVLSSGNYQYLFSYFNSGNTDGYGLAYFASTDTLYVYAGGTLQQTTAVYRDPAAWYHIVLSNNAGSFTLYVNGVSVKTGTAATIPSNSSMNIGRYGYGGGLSYFDGEMAEVNFVDGQALAPTAFGAYSTYNQWLPKKYAGTYGTNGFYLPFNSVSTSSYAGSFNGSSQYLTVPDNAAFTLGTNDFTVEAWIYATTAAQGAICGQTNAAYATANTSMTFYRLTDGRIACFVAYNSGSSFELITTLTAPLSTWTHVAAVRDGATLRVYVNGVQSATATISTGVVNDSASLFAVGRPGDFAGQYFPGYISNFRLVNGTCLYLSGTTFIPPIAALTAVTNTKLLTLQNATIVDNSTNAFTITNNGTVVTSVQYPFTLAIAADSSGNANNWTPNNISLTAGSTYDSLTDVPTLTSATVANYAVLNPLMLASTTLSNGNLTATKTATVNVFVTGTIAISSGKWYWECLVVTQAALGNIEIGVIKATATSATWALSSGVWWGDQSPNNAYRYGTNLGSIGISIAAGNVLGIALDMNAGTIALYQNNTLINTISSVDTTTPHFPMWNSYASGDAGSLNFGQQPFTYTPPSGFLPLNTFNI